MYMCLFFLISVVGIAVVCLVAVTMGLGHCVFLQVNDYKDVVQLQTGFLAVFSLKVFEFHQWLVINHFLSLNKKQAST